jgi:hypothetical protein
MRAEISPAAERRSTLGQEALDFWPRVDIREALHADPMAPAWQFKEEQDSRASQLCVA